MKIKSALLKTMMSLMKHTSFFVKDKKFFEDLPDQNKVLVVFWHPQCQGCEEIMRYFPILMAKALKKWYKIKFCNFKMFPQHCCWIGVKFTPSVYIKDEKWEARVISNIDQIKDFIKSF